MPVAPTQQFDFTAGFLDPTMEARKDLERYYKGAKDAKNVILRSTGGLEDRGGTAFVAELADAAVGARLARFEFSNEQVYLFGLTDQKLHVYKDDKLQTGAGVATPWLAADLPELDLAQALDNMLVAHEDYQQRRIERAGSHTAWNVNTITFANQPTIQTGDDTTSTGTPSVTTGSGTFTSGSAEFVANDVGKWIVGNQGRAKITGFTSSTQVSITVHQDFKDTSAIPAGDWTIEEEVFDATNGWPRSVALTEGRSIWGGSKTFLSTAFMSRSGKPFDHKVTYEALADEAAQATLEGKAVPVINRVSEFGDLFIFTAGGIFAVIPPAGQGLTPETFIPRRQTSTPAAQIPPVEIEEAGGFIMADEEGNPIGLHELLWSESDQSYVAQDLSLLAQSLMRTPVDMAARKGRKQATSAVHVFIVNGDDGSVAVFHSRRKQNISGWTIWDSPGNSGTDKVLRTAVVGNQAYFLVQRTINGVTRYYIEKQVPGRFFDCSVARSSALTITNATQANPVVITAGTHGLANGEKVWIEDVGGMVEINDRQFTVANVTATTFELQGEDGTGHTAYTSGGTVKYRSLSGLSHLNGETVKVWADGALRDDQEVSGGIIDITDGGDAFEVSAVEAGMEFTRRVETMPLEAQLSNGTLVGSRHRIVEAVVRVKEAYDFTVNGRKANFRQAQSVTLDSGLAAKTGEVRVRPGGWKGRRSGEATVIIESTLPLGVESVTAFVSG